MNMATLATTLVSMNSKVQQYNETVVGFIEKKIQQYQQKIIANFNDLETDFQGFFNNKAHGHYVNVGIVKVLDVWYDYFSFGEREKMTEADFWNYIGDREQKIVGFLNEQERKILDELSNPFQCTANLMKNISCLFDREVTLQVCSILKECLLNIKAIRLGL